MKKVKGLDYILLVVILLTLNSCIVDSSWLKLVGRWQDVEYPDMELEFTKGGQFHEYFLGELVGYGEFYAVGKEISLKYLSACGDNGLSCVIKLNFNVTEDTLIITDSVGDIYYKKVSVP